MIVEPRAMLLDVYYSMRRRMTGEELAKLSDNEFMLMLMTMDKLFEAIYALQNIPDIFVKIDPEADYVRKDIQDFS